MVNVYTPLTGLCCPLFGIGTSFSSPFLRMAHLEPKGAPCTPLLKSFLFGSSIVYLLAKELSNVYCPLFYDHPLLRTSYSMIVPY